MSDSEEQSADKQIKLVLLGDCACGKTAVISKLLNDTFCTNYTPTVGLDFSHKRLILPGDVYVALQIHDVSGQSLRSAMLMNYIYGAQGLLFMYDITNAESFDAVEEWYTIIATVLKDTPFPYCALIANKVDLEHLRSVPMDKHKKFVDERETASFIVSAKTGDCIKLCFNTIAAQIAGVRLPRALQHADVVKADVVQQDHIVTGSSSHTSVCSLQ